MNLTELVDLDFGIVEAGHAQLRETGAYDRFPADSPIRPRNPFFEP